MGFFTKLLIICKLFFYWENKSVYVLSWSRELGVGVTLDD